SGSRSIQVCGVVRAPDRGGCGPDELTAEGPRKMLDTRGIVQPGCPKCPPTCVDLPHPLWSAASYPAICQQSRMSVQSKGPGTVFCGRCGSGSSTRDQRTRSATIAAAAPTLNRVGAGNQGW